MNCLKLRVKILGTAINTINRRLISALYVTGDKAKENYAVLQPYMDFSEVFSNAKLMQENIDRRRLQVDFGMLQNKYQSYIEIVKRKKSLESHSKSIVEKLRALSKQNDVEESDVEKIKEEGRLIRTELKSLKDSFYTIEDDFVQEFLKFPNKLDTRCPTEHSRILYRNGLPDEQLREAAKFHLSRKDLIDYRDSSCYYLLNDAALFDLEFPMKCTDFLVRKGYTQMVNPDFSRRILLEAVYSDDIKSYEEVKEHDANEAGKINTLHLNGGGSLTSFLGFIAKLTVFPSVLPLKMVSFGRLYESDQNLVKKDEGLFSALQSNAVQVFVAAPNEQSASEEIDTILNLVVDIYKLLGIHFQIVYEKAEKIFPSEMLRASIQMYSPHLGKHIEVGAVSSYGDFVSKRLLFNFKDGKTLQFPHIVAGPVINVSKIIGCLIEHNVDLKSPHFSPTQSAVDEFKNLFEIK